MNKEIFDLLHQYEFKQWVLQPTEESNLYWQKWLQNNPNKRQALLQAREIILRMRFKHKELSEEEKDEILTNVISLTQSNGMPIQAEKRKWLWLKVAASLVFIFLFSFIIYYSIVQNTPNKLVFVSEQYIIKENPKGIKTHFQLPDGSNVILNAQSKLIFPNRFSDSLRYVELTGEAFFEVESDPERPFEVKVESHKVSVLGTKFNINAYPESDRIKVALLEGKVSIKKEDELNSESHLLIPGQKFQFIKDKNLEQVVSFNSLLEFGWKDGILVFENAGFDLFIEKLEKWYGVEVGINGQPSEKWNVDGTFDNESLEEILKGVSFTHDINYEINGDKVMIYLD